MYFWNSVAFSMIQQMLAIWSLVPLPFLKPVWTKIKHKERILKAGREKQQVTYKENPIYLTADLSAGTLQARSKWQDIFKILKGNNLQPRLLYPAKISFKIAGEIKSFTDEQKLREFSTTKPALQQMLKGLIQLRNTREGKRSTKSTPNN